VEFLRQAGSRRKRGGGDRGAVRRTVLASLGVFLIARLVVIASIIWAANASGRSALWMLTRSDGTWYLSIARHGYATTKTLVFFPFYPALIHLFAWAMDPRIAALVVTAIAGLVATVLMTLWAIRLAGSVAAVVLIGIWNLWPSSVVLSWHIPRRCLSLLPQASCLRFSASGGCGRRWHVPLDV
jgi:hypothetical protein